MRESVGEEEYVKARTSARTQVTAALRQEHFADEQPTRSSTTRAPIDLDKVESDEPLMTAAGVPASFFPAIEYDEEGKPRPARLYDVSHRDDPPVETINPEDVSDARNDDTYRPLG